MRVEICVFNIITTYLKSLNYNSINYLQDLHSAYLAYLWPILPYELNKL